ncbi:MAG: homoserine kinase [Candidatus Sumerlaeota bacterium]|nr:homoserine kinase [Candidatus Sumerlaeota bacterium]
MTIKKKDAPAVVARRVRVRVPASTSNLGPGFDCLGLALSLYNIFVLEPADEVSVSVHFQNNDEHDGQLMDSGRNNLVWRAASEVIRRCGARLPGLKIKMDIAVPLARGLGSSATAIIAGVAGANALLGAPLSDDEVFRLIANFEGHPDNVAASYYGGLTVATTHNGIPRVIRYSANQTLRAVAAIPPYPLSTEKARAALPKEIPFADAAHNVARVPFVIHALIEGDVERLGWAMDDRMHEPYRIALLRNGRAIRKAAQNAGAAGVAISGAGPTMIAFCLEPQAKAVAEAMRGQMKEGRVEILEIESKGVRTTIKK